MKRNKEKEVCDSRTPGTRGWATLLVAAAILASSCAPSATPSVQPTTAPAPEPRFKTLTLGATVPVKSFGPWDLGSTEGGSTTFFELHSMGLVSGDAKGNLEGRLAERLPSLSDGSIVVLPDGRMRTTWKLRPNVRWHDGTPFTSQDLVLGYQVLTHPEVPIGGGSEAMDAIERVESPDPVTFEITWKTTFFHALELGIRELWPYPHHLIADAFLGPKQAFMTLPYFNSGYVHLGPFRVVEFGFGENMVLERFDDYFLGRPKIDRIFIRVIGNENALFANLRAGVVDIAAEQTLPLDVFAELRDEWKTTGGGSVLARQGNWRYFKPQFNIDLARPVELAKDVRIRRGLYHGLNRDAIREISAPGFPDTESDSFMIKTDPRAAAVGQPFARYAYDPRRASEELAAAGWLRAPDGRLLNQAGEQIKFTIRFNQAESKFGAISADSFQQQGIEATQEITPQALARDRQYSRSFTGLDHTGRSTGDAIFVAFDSRLMATEATNFFGANTNSYANPGLDRMIDDLYRTIDEREQGVLLKQMGDILAADLAAMPTYFRINLVAMVKGVHALTDDFAGTHQPGGGPGYMSRNAHLWDRD